MRGHAFAARLMLLFEKIIKPEQLDQLQGEPRSAERFFIFDTNSLGVDLDLFRLKFVTVEQFCLHEFRLAFAFGDFFDAFAFRLFELPQVRDDSLA